MSWLPLGSRWLIITSCLRITCKYSSVWQPLVQFTVQAAELIKLQSESWKKPRWLQRREGALPSPHKYHCVPCCAGSPCHLLSTCAQAVILVWTKTLFFPLAFFIILEAILSPLDQPASLWFTSPDEEEAGSSGSQDVFIWSRMYKWSRDTEEKMFLTASH